MLASNQSPWPIKLRWWQTWVAQSESVYQGNNKSATSLTSQARSRQDSQGHRRQYLPSRALTKVLTLPIPTKGLRSQSLGPPKVKKHSVLFLKASRCRSKVGSNKSQTLKMLWFSVGSTKSPDRFQQLISLIFQRKFCPKMQRNASLHRSTRIKHTQECSSKNVASGTMLMTCPPPFRWRILRDSRWSCW